jgi:hypothetical protein
MSSLLDEDEYRRWRADSGEATRDAEAILRFVDAWEALGG